jgi:type III pantothenate kinase
MRLEFDIGNTNHKWRIVDESGVWLRGHFANHSEGLHGVPYQGVEEIWVSCVGKDTLLMRLLDWAQEHKLPVQRAVVTAEAEGVVCAYKEPYRLGVDRWLAVLAAYHRYGASCIIDIGSAMTVDVVDAQGQHLGGYIVPGYQLLLNALAKDTDKVRWMDREVGDDLSPACDTANAVAAGAKLMLAGFVEQAVARLPIAPVQVVFTGGGCDLLRKVCQLHGEWQEDLVFEGLAWAHRETLL